ncbi:hypothetical protein LI99_32385 [Mycolicibacterium smegmatis]|uniref:Uncharacterized protein n=4 Tax=Mycolicibacterium smegmatis TaxID=1772 RepID=I7FND2_MYCS2|nr:hypothetical protein MSMEG_6551 [Mycolicibacterium smegmatis MC2 155]AIU18150.1 hypothetical protein LI99_32385 [Mycolicibacterium smegmatis]AFP42800.1 hypothetical protein MSMEI_6374 [Mycolicibacterium smegmatis MC2 155]AIU11525.1 hypothetical protein LJ00_32380 [Mycolicibacterium smegmatis MC2 155]AIU24772.1 hypothetical protein LI98_32390 [Mycolicibacterium smegmatis]
MLVGMNIKGPIATIGAVAVVGTGLFLLNVSRQPEPTASGNTPAATSTATAPTGTAAVSPAPAAPPATPTTPAPRPFADREDFVADIPTKTGNIALEIRVDGAKARAYACDNKGIETWMWGTAENGVLKLADQAKTSELNGTHQGNTVVGNLRINDKNWDFTAVPGATSVF